MVDIQKMTAAELRKHDEQTADMNEGLAALARELLPVDGGKDPDDMNDARLEWGQSLAEHLRDLTGADPEDAVSDAICDLLHAAKFYGETAEKALKRAVAHFNAETGEGEL